MSVVVKTPDKKIKVMTKGAVSIFQIFPSWVRFLELFLHKKHEITSECYFLYNCTVLHISSVG